MGRGCGERMNLALKDVTGSESRVGAIGSRDPEDGTSNSVRSVMACYYLIKGGHLMRTAVRRWWLSREGEAGERIAGTGETVRVWLNDKTAKHRLRGRDWANRALSPH